jgi:uncharacterized protein YodC (DUF2158 family)
MLDSISEIKPGMIVKTKGSVIPMAVDAVDGLQVGCYWFDNDMLKKADFYHAELVPLKQDMAASSLLAGHQVRLKSGSPVMKVERIEFKKNKPYAICSWRSGNAQYLKKFNSLALEKVEE